MAIARFRGRGRDAHSGLQWPGYVDALSTLLLVFIFVLTVFVLAQYVMSQAIAGRDEQLSKLNQRIVDLADQLALEQQSTRSLRADTQRLQASLTQTTQARDDLAVRLTATTSRAEDAESRLKRAEETVKVEREALAARLADIEGLKRDIATLRQVRADLETRVGQLAGELDRTKKDAGELRDRGKQLEARLADAEERTRLSQSEIQKRDTRLVELQMLYTQGQDSLATEKKLTEQGRAQVSALDQQLAAIRQQLASLQAALGAAEAKDKESQAQISDLGKRLNVALAQKVEELAKYRSAFFQRLTEAIGDRRELQVVGDRFVLQSELLFGSGSAELNEQGLRQIDKLATTLIDLGRRIPADVAWVLRVDGHTDKFPINTDRYRSNWDLASARAISVVRYLADRGVPSERLAATGFAEFQPLDNRDDPEAYRKNRRIELKLTER
jgi:chemotaxis protein MotB